MAEKRLAKRTAGSKVKHAASPAPTEIAKQPKPVVASRRPARLSTEQRELLRQISEGVMAGDYTILRTADQSVLQSLWDRKLISVRSVPQAVGVSPENRERIKKAVLAAKEQG